MSDFSVNPDKIMSISDLLDQQANQIERSSASIISAKNRLTIEGSSGANVRSVLDKISGDAREESRDANKMAKTLREIANVYRQTERRIAGLWDGSTSTTFPKGGKGGGGGGARTPGNKNQHGKNRGSGKYSSDPVNLNTGNFLLDNYDIEIPGEEPLIFQRFYNSCADFKGFLGKDWNSCFEARLLLRSSQNMSGSDITVFLEDGREEHFIAKDDNIYLQITGTTSELVRDLNGYVYKTLDGEIYRFNQEGLYIRQENSRHVGFDLIYDDGVLRRVQKDSGEFFAFNYEENGLLSYVEDHTGRMCKYIFSDFHLSEVVLPDGNRFSYTYGTNGKIIRVKNPLNLGAVETEYDDNFRVTYQKFADGTTNVFEYLDSESAVVLTERNGTKSIHYHNDKLQNIHNIYSDGEEYFEYNNRGQKTRIQDKAGNVHQIHYDNRGNVTGLIRPDGTKWSATYNSRNQLLTLSVNGVMKTKNVFNDYGDLISTEDGIGRRIEYKYDDRGRIINVTLPDDSKIIASYDDRGNLVKAETADGSTYSFEYDNLNQLVAYFDRGGCQASYEYDVCGRVTSETRSDGSSRLYKYDASGNILSMMDFDGSVVNVEYTVLNKPKVFTDQMGRKTYYEYDAMWNVSKMIIPGGSAFSYVYNQENRLEKWYDAEGNETQYTYDAMGNILTETDPMNNTTQFEWDNCGRCVKVTAPDGTITEYGYDPEDHLIYKKDAEGIELFREFDAAEHLIREYDSLGHQRSYSYDKLGRLIVFEDEKGQKTHFHYMKGSDRITTVVYADGTKEKYSYDNRGNISTFTNALGKTLNYEFDQLDRLTRILDDQGSLLEYTYDPMGRLLTETNTEGGSTEYTYSATGQLILHRNALGFKTRYIYDEADQLLEVIREQAEGMEPVRTCYERNRNGQITKIEDALGNIETYDYNANGQMISRKDRDGYVTTYKYNSVSLLCGVIWSDGREAAYSYSPLRRLNAVHDWTGETKISYDSLGNVTRITYPDERETKSVYDSHGNRTKVTYPDGLQVSYEYDDLDRLKRLFHNDQNVIYDYDEFGQIMRKQVSEHKSIDYKYTHEGLVNEIRYMDGDTVSDQLIFNYDRYGHRKDFYLYRRDIPQDNGMYQYSYDLEGQLSSVFKDDKLLRKYKYDPLGRRSSLEYMNPISGTMEKSCYSYNRCGALLSLSGPDFKEEFHYDKRGNLTGVLRDKKIEKEYLYDALNRLAAVNISDGRKAEYLYNGLGYRIGMQNVENGVKCNTSYTLDYSRIYDNLLERRTEGEKSEDFIWALGLEGFSTNENNSGWYLTDPLGSALLRESPEGLSFAANYDEFGRKLAAKGTDIFGYNGFLEDPIAGTSFAQARQYRSYTGTFDAMDRFGGDITMPATMNAYVYCVQDPFTHTDKSAYWVGLDDAIAAGAGALGGIAGQLAGDVVDGVTTGTWDFKWQEYTGAALGGAAGGITTLYAGPIAGGAVAGGTTRLFTEGITYASDPKEYSKSGADILKETAVDTGVGALSGAATELAGKITQKIAGLKPVKNLASKLSTKGKLGNAISKHLSNMATGKSTKRWDQISNLLKHQHGTIAKNPSFKKKMYSILLKGIPVYIGQEVLEKIIDEIKPTKLIWNKIRGKMFDDVKQMTGVTGDGQACVAAGGGFR